MKSLFLPLAPAREDFQWMSFRRPPIIIISSLPSQDTHIDTTTKKGDDDDDDTSTTEHSFVYPVFSSQLSSNAVDRTPTTIFHQLLARFPTNPVDNIDDDDDDNNNNNKSKQYTDAIVETKMAFDAACQREDRLRTMIREKVKRNLNVSCSRIGRLTMAIARNESVDIDDYCQHVASPIVLSEDTSKDVDLKRSATTVGARNVRRRESNPKQSQLFKGLSKMLLKLT
jgi:hypothetical protein